MNKILKYTGFAAIGVLIWYVYDQFQKSKNVVINLKKVSIDRSKLLNLTSLMLPLNIVWDFYNPTDIELNVSVIKLDCFLNDQFLGSIRLNEGSGYVIKSKTHNKINTDIDVDLSKIGKTLNFALDYFQGLKKGSVICRGFVQTNLGLVQVFEKYDLK